jgi:hypothetical protein
LAALFIVAAMLGGVAQAATRKFVPTISPGCVLTGSTPTFTVTIKNNGSSTSSLGSAQIHSNRAKGFSNIFKASFSTVVVKNANGQVITTKTWRAVADTFDSDGVYLQATNTSSSLAAGESATMSYTAKAPSTPGDRTWASSAWVGTKWLGTAFSIPSSSPIVHVLSVCVGPPDHLAFLQQPNDAKATAAIAPPVSVRVEDASNNLVTSPAVNITLAMGSNPGGGTLSGATATTSGGIATFPTLSINKVGVGYTVTASSTIPPLTGPVPSNPFNITLGDARQISYVANNGPSNTTAGSVMNQVKVLVTDGNNPVSGDVVTLTGDISGSPTGITDAGGVATFNVPNGNAITVSQTPEVGATLTATEGNQGQQVSSDFDISAPNVAFVQQPSDTLFGHTITPAVTVTVTDPNNSNNGISGVPVTISIGLNPAFGVLSGTLTQTTDGSGVATFSDLSIGPSSASSSGYQLSAIAEVAGSDSAPFEITSAQAQDCSGGCTTTATSPGGGTVTASVGGGTGSLSIIFESQPLTCLDSHGNEIVPNPVLGTFTVDPPADAPSPVTLEIVAPITFPFQESYPICKTVEGGGTQLVEFCADTDGVLPCMESQKIDFHGNQTPKYTLHTVIDETATDPGHKL